MLIAGGSAGANVSVCGAFLFGVGWKGTAYDHGSAKKYRSMVLSIDLFKLQIAFSEITQIRTLTILDQKIKGIVKVLDFG